METEGTTSQPLGNDVLGALMAQVEARNDAIRSELDAMRGEISTFSGRLGQRLLSRGQTPQIQRSYTSPNPKTPTQTCPQPKPIPSHQTTLNQIPFIQVEKEKKMQSKESESKHQVGEKMNSEVQEECEERREKERDATGSEKEKEYLIVDLVHKGPLLFTNPNASTLPSIDSSHVQVQDYRILEEKSKEVPFKTLAENPNFGISDEEVSPKGNLGIFPCNVEHEGCHDAKPSDEHTSYDLQGNKAILCTYRNLNYCDVASSGQSGVVSDLLGVEVSKFEDKFLQDGEDDTSMKSTKRFKIIIKDSRCRLKTFWSLFEVSIKRRKEGNLYTQGAPQVKGIENILHSKIDTQEAPHFPYSLRVFFTFTI
ncbi:uncharacterized protein LOC107860413 isoform X2 [Capsicum annuum]|uniref:uncharacterized protein LOC107860413 isoform X2 n=1 Tax=Capsicum annuum TaxID=4072 RepID=UPI0007BEBBC8|nr:uncharacterized protein LOC107860413 isoform X2 [Capsicum annuum]